MAMLLVCNGGISFRGVSKVFIAINLSFNLELRVPTHATVLVWMKKQGIANFRESNYFEQEKWVLIIDESVQFGNKKLLVVLAVKETDIKSGKALKYRDLVPLIIKASTSWKSDEIKDEIEARVDLKQISYAVSDNGNNLKGCYQLAGLKHIEDVGHKFSWFMKEVFEKYPDFENYTKHLSGLRGKLSLSKFAHLIPPNQRIISRFMNLTPLFNWGCRILKLLDNKVLAEEEQEKVAFVLQYRTFILQTQQLLCALNSVQQIIKTKQLCKNSLDECLVKLNTINDVQGKKVVEMIRNYFENTLQKLPESKIILCCSDIIESCFGKYKEVVKSNKSVGVTDLCLTISCLTSSHDSAELKQTMESVKVKQIKEWRDENVGETLLAKRNKLFKKAG
jgi:hypothetical protein